jgi:metal-sulfur cluster biosynthetic enzyme
MNKTEIAEVELELLTVLKTVLDPEVELNIVDLGLIYELYFDGYQKVNVVMTFSTPACPLGETIITAIKEAIKQQYPSFQVIVDVVFHPQWHRGMISDEGKKILGL